MNLIAKAPKTQSWVRWAVASLIVSVGTGVVFRSTSRLDKVFEVGILLKGLDGLLEVTGGILLFFIKPGYLNHLAITLTQHELAEDPRDFLATHILHSSQNLAAGSLVFAALYLLSHGLVKIVLVWEILHNRFWAYLGLIYLTIGFMLYQISHNLKADASIAVRLHTSGGTPPTSSPAL